MSERKRPRIAVVCFLASLYARRTRNKDDLREYVGYMRELVTLLEARA